MALHDWVCPACAEELHGQYRPAADWEKKPSCPACGATMEILWVGRCAMDLITPFEFDWDDGRVETVTTLHRIRQIERETEAMAKNGLGQREIAFRSAHQDSSNRDVNVFGRRDQPRPITRSRRGVPFVTQRGGPPPED